MIFYPINLKGGENTKSKRLFIILAILIILSIGAVNAADNSTDGALNATDQESLGDSPDPGSFTELNNYITQEISQGHTTISLNKSYEFVAGDDAAGISISAQGLTIEGNGKTIDAKNLARIFTLSSSGITLNNINFTHASKHAVVVEDNAANCVINNSYFYHNSLANGHGNPGGAILWNGENGKVTNSVFHNNSVQFTNDTTWDRGGSIYWNGDYGYLAYCDFSDDFAYQLGGSVSWGNNESNPKNGRIYRCNFTNSKVLYHGGALSIAGESCSVIECNFTGNTAVHAGAVMVEDGADKTNITRCIFKDNHVEYNGTINVLTDKDLVGPFSSAGALEIDSSRVTVNHCEFLSNFVYIDDVDHGEGFAGFYAGAAKVGGNAEFVRILNSNFTDNHAQYCGAIEWNGYKGLVDNCNFTLNHADDNGAIGWNGNDGLVDNSNFTENYAENNAGAVCWDGENGKVFNSNFTDNTADEAGAILWNGENGNVSNSNFTKNTATYDGGAIIWQGNNGIVSKSKFLNNTAEEYYGGAIFWGNFDNYEDTNMASDGTISESVFMNNRALEKSGGAVFWQAKKGNISDNCNFFNNSATSGGAIQWKGANGHVSYSNFTENHANDEGGAIMWESENGEVFYSNFTDNTAKNGGAIQWKGANGHVSYSNFTKNNAAENAGAIRWSGVNGKVFNSNFTKNSAENAGAIFWDYTDDNEVGIILSCLFLNNSADDTAGAVRLECNNPTINNSTFINNSANSGGAIYSWVYGKFTLTNNSYFINNRAHSNGGAILVSESECEFSDLEFKDNNATNYGGAIGVSGTYPSSIKIINAKFNGNNATSGSAIYLEKDSEIYLENIKFGKNRADAVKITIDIDKNLTYYPSNVTIKMTLYGRDNIVNAIWNDKTDSTDNVFLKNITYEVVNGAGQLENKTFYENEQGWINPILGADRVTNKDTQIWQDDREYAQSLLYQISDEKGKVIVPWTENLTYIYGNVTEIARNYKAGNYTVEAKHEWDKYYTNVSNTAKFEVLPFVILNITKTANVTDMINGTLVNFTITVNNTSLLTATNVTVVDTLPVGLEYYSSEGVYYSASRTVVWRIDNLSGSTKLWIVARATALGTLNNTVSVNCNENKTDVTANRTVNVLFANFTVNKTVDLRSIDVNKTVNYTIFINNTGEVNLTNIKVHDKFTDRFVLIDYSDKDKWSYNNDGVFTYNGNITVKGNATLVLVVQLTQPGVYNNTVNVTSGEVENKTSTSENTTVYNPSLNVTKVVETSPIIVGDKAVFTINVTNTGDRAIKDVRVFEQYNSALIYDTFLSVKGEWNIIKTSDMSYFYIESLDINESASFKIYFNTTIRGTFENNVTARFEDNENVKNASDEVTVEPIPTHTTVGNVTGYPGENVTIPVNVTADDGKPFTGQVNVTFPDGTSKIVDITNGTGNTTWKIPESYVPGDYPDHANYTGNETYLPSNGTGNVKVLPIPTNTTIGNVTGYPGQEVTIPVNVTADDGKPFTGKVNVTFPDGTSKIVDITNGTGNTTWKIPESYVPGDYPDHANYTGNETYLPSNGSGNVKVLPIPTNTTVGNVTGYPGQNVTIPVNVTADDGKPFNGKVNVTLPDGDIKEVTITNGTGNVTWTIPSDLPTGNYTVPGNYSGNVTYLPSNGTGNVEVIPIPTITTIGNVTGYAGHNVTIPVNVTADDGIPFTGQVNVTFPDGTSKIVDIVNGTGSTVWKIPETYVPGDYPDKANFTGRYPYLPSHGPGYVRVIPIPTNTEIGNVTGTPGQNVTIPVNVTTDDGEPFNGTVNVTLPDGTTHEVNITNGTGNITWHIPDDFKPGDYPDSADYAGNNTYQPSKGSGVVKVVIIDVELKITVDRPNVDYGDYVEFIVTVHNKGPSDATGVIAKISIPEGFVYVSDNCTDKNYQSKRALLKASASSQSYDAKKGLWFIGDLANDETVKLAIIAQANFLGTKAVPASVSIEEPETDYTNNNGSVSVSVKPVADVQIVKTVDKTKIKPGDKVTYTFTVTNNGPNDATGVKVVDSQLTKFKFVKASSKDYYKNTGEWTIGKLANGSSVTLTVTVIIDKVGNYPNTATVSSNEKDSNMSNNKASSKVVSVVKVGGPHDKIKDHGSDKKTADKDAKSDSTVSKMHETGNPIFMALIVVLGLILLPLRRRK